MLVVVSFIALLFVYSLVSRRLEETLVTPPILFTAAGIVLAALGEGGIAAKEAAGPLLVVAELGLVLLLFTDASKTSVDTIRSLAGLPVRLLSAGMLLTIALGGVLAFCLLPGLSAWQSVILGAILAPTDAGLGQVVVADDRVPERVRTALKVEAGLNDGLSVPFLLFFIALSGAEKGGGSPSLLVLVAEQVGLGALLGASLGFLGGRLLRVAQARGWMAEKHRPVGLLAIPVLCLLLSEPIGASMFVAAFVAGVAVQLGLGHAAAESAEFAEGSGQILNLFIFFLFGTVTARDATRIEWRHVAYAAASLTVIRMAPVALALRGIGLARPTVLFMGWFGPRGLASIVLFLVYRERVGRASAPSDLALAATATVFASVFAHGVTARPAIAAYARRLASLPPSAPELVPRRAT